MENTPGIHITLGNTTTVGGAFRSCAVTLALSGFMLDVFGKNKEIPKFMYTAATGMLLAGVVGSCIEDIGDAIL